MCAAMRAGRAERAATQPGAGRRGGAGPRREPDHRRARSPRSWSASSARTPGSRSSGTSSAAGRPARSTATWARCSATPPSSGCWPTPATGSRSWSACAATEVVSSPLMECVARDPRRRRAHRRARPRGRACCCAAAASRSSTSILSTMQQAAPRPTAAGRQRFRIAVVHGGGPAPGMNTAVRAAVRLGLDRGYSVLAVQQRLPRAARRDHPARWTGWTSAAWSGPAAPSSAPTAGCPAETDLAQIAEQLAGHRIDGAADGGRVERIRRRARAAHRPPPLPGAGPPDRLPADDDQQRPAGHRADHRQRHRAEQHHRRRRQDQAVGGGDPAVLRRRGDGPRLGLPRADERPGQRRRAGLPARGGHHPGGLDPGRAVRWPKGSAPASGSAW